MSVDFRKILSGLPLKPGVYQFLNSEGKVIYVGKAKNLKSRVSSYFNKQNNESAKTKILVKNISDILFFVVQTEYEALLLENNMIKKYQPRYNIQLKDDKTYPFICIKKERFPRVFPTRNLIRDGSDYFGPYASVKMMNTMIDLIRQLYPLRNCTFDLSEKNISSGKFKVCLEYHVKNCLGPCEGKQNESEYNEYISDIKNILKGHILQVITHLKQKMNSFSENLEYEKASLIKEKLDVLQNFKGKSTVVSPGIRDLDVFSIIEDGNSVFVNFLKVVNGAIIQGHTLELNNKLNESLADLLLMAIAEIRQRFSSATAEICVPFHPVLEIPEVKWTVPQRGDKKKLLELSERNARFFMMDKIRRMEKVDPENYTDKIMALMQLELRLPQKPVHIECFDNSNIQGSNAVAACVVFRKGKPSKKDYRHFNIRTVTGPDDFASMKEIVYRRYSRMIDENRELPQLIVIDGGKGQLSAAVESLEKLQIRGKISIIGIAKKLEEIYFPDDPVPLYLSKKSETLKVIQYIRNEAHRFGITHHRSQRSKSMMASTISGIKGIGSESEKQLLRKFKSLKRIREAKEEELAEIVGKKRADILLRYFNQES